MTDPAGRARPRLPLVALGALGIVYGDIGTSPLYALRECFHGPHAIAPTSANVLGVLSLVVWSLVLIVTVKYLVFVMRADNRGEGGILALMTLALRPGHVMGKRARYGLELLGLFGAALLYGDGMITPAISVLSAVEGLEVATPVLAPYVVPITVAIIAGLFLIQRHGTARVGALFGPVMLVWFVVLALLGVAGIARHPGVLAALNPAYAVGLFVHEGARGFLVLGAVFLVVTGGEALYADMGHFGRRPIRVAWFAVVLPALVANYFGQGALLLTTADVGHQPFFMLAPAWARYPLVVLATAATVIASQAMISGAFSLTRQAVQLGYAPRLTIVHTSAAEIGQIYVPAVNWALFVSVVYLVLEFGSSNRLAAAYGMAVTATMVITTVLAYVVARHLWGWGRPAALLVLGGLLVLDVAFFAANLVKVHHGGWVALVAGAAVFTLMTTWRRGRELMTERIAERSLALGTWMRELAATPPKRVPGTAVYMSRSPQALPQALLFNTRHNHVLHERVVLLTVVTEDVPRVEDDARVELTRLEHGLVRVVARYGFMEEPNVPELLHGSRELGLNPAELTFVLGRDTLLATERPGMALWRERLFTRMVRNALGATQYYGLPPSRVIEIGVQIEL